MPCLSLTVNTELLLLSFIGLGISVYEGTYQDLYGNLKDVWNTDFPRGVLPGNFENGIRMIMSGVVVARALTVHVHIASYLLMVYPLITEKLRVLLAIWLFVSAIRSIIINTLAAVTGILICSSLHEMHPACFEFSAVKAAELACSVYMWLTVNDCYHRMHSGVRRRRRSCNAQEHVNQCNVHNAMAYPVLDSDSSYGSIEDSSTDLDFDEVELTSEDSMMAKQAVDWLMRQAFGIKYENRYVESDISATQKFLKMTDSDLKDLEQRLLRADEPPGKAIGQGLTRAVDTLSDLYNKALISRDSSSHEIEEVSGSHRTVGSQTPGLKGRLGRRGSPIPCLATPGPSKKKIKSKNLNDPV